VLLGTVRRTGTSVGSLTTSPPLPSRIRKYARTIIDAGVGVGVGGATVGLGVAGVRVGDGVADGVGATVAVGDGEAVGDERLALGAPEAVVLGLAAGPEHAASSASMRSATAGRRRNM
jgi:hypothetical protein